MVHIQQELYQCHWILPHIVTVKDLIMHLKGEIVIQCGTMNVLSLLSCFYFALVCKIFFT